MRVRDRAGFTLVELLIALVISGIVGTVIFQVLRGQSQFTRLQGAREEVQQNARAALELLGSELRGVGRLGILTATPEAITFHSPRSWGVACGYVAGELVVLFPAGSAPALTPDAAVTLAIQAGTTPEFLPVRMSTGDLDQAAAACNAAAAPAPAATAARVRRFTDAPAGVPAAARAYVAETVTFDGGTADGLTGNWLRRNGVPVAGPLPANGLRFQYLNAAGAAAATVDEIESIRIDVVTQSRARFNQAPQNTHASTLIHLRNRSGA